MPLVKQNSRKIFGWCMYDWANSAYSTTIIAGVLPPYFASVVVGSEGFRIGNIQASATTIWSFAIALSSFIAFVTAPVLGAISDFSAAKKRFLLAFAYGGALFTTLLFFCGSGDVYLTLVLFLMAQVGFIGANVFYDAFITEVATPEKMDAISSKGYSYGYVGGGLQFTISLGLVAGHEFIGIAQATAVKLAILTAGLWWAGFSLFTVVYLTESGTAQPLPPKYKGWPRLVAYTAIGVSRTLETARRVKRFRHLVLFLVAFMLYNDGIQTVIEIAGIYGAEELKLPVTTLMITLLIIQFIATAGAILFSWIASKMGTKRAIMLSLAMWSGVVIYAFFMTTSTEYFGLGVIVGIVLGGSQALSRSFYGSMVPAEASAEFFGFYTVFSKFSAIWAPTVFGVISHNSGSRIAILSIIFFFVSGLVLMALVDERKARQAKEYGLFDEVAR